MSKNEVLNSTRVLIENPKYVFIKPEKIDSAAAMLSQDGWNIPSWKADFYPEGDDNYVTDFFFLTNTINFAFTDFSTGQKYSQTYKGKEISGAGGMVASVKKALEAGIPLLDSNFLRDISNEQMSEIFRGNIDIPMLTERAQIFREVGRILFREYGGSFHNLVNRSEGLAFNNGKGIVERLAGDFPSFNDSVEYNQQRVIFNKRAQLAVGQVHGRFLAEGRKFVKDIEKLTAFADYVLPKGMRDMGLLGYEKSLADRVDKQIIIPAGSQEELEIRASTIHCFEMLRQKLGLPNALALDAKIWYKFRKGGSYHHLTPTIDY